MSVPQRINDFVTSHRPNPLCNRCVAYGAGFKNEAYPAQITAALATTSEFVQEPGTCFLCKRDKKVIRRV